MLYADRFRLIWTPMLKKRGSRTYQAVGLVFPPVLGSGGELTLTVGGKKYAARKFDLLKYPTPVPTQDDEHFYLWLIPRPAEPVTCRAVWKTPLGQTYRDSIKLVPAEPSRVHVIFKTHLDLGYTHRFDEVVRLFQTEHLARLLDNLEQTADRKPGRRFVWTLSTWLLEQCLDPKGVSADHRKRLERFVRSGQVVWGLMPFTTHSEFFGLEEMCRSLYGARRLAERFGGDVPTAAKMTDVPAHTAALAMAFAAAGGNFFQVGTNPDCRPPSVPPLFWWKLPDRQRMLCHVCGNYGTSLLPPPEWPYRDWLAVQMTNDNEGPGDLALVDHLAWIEEHFDAPVCRTGRLEDFADSVIQHQGDEVPEVEGECTDWWIHGIGSQARPTATARRDKDRLPAIETLRTLAAWINGQPVPERDRARIREAYQQLALYTEHTWGDHATDFREVQARGNRYTSKVFAGPKPAPPVDRWVGSWADKAQFAEQARTAVDDVTTRTLDTFAAHVAGRGREVGIALFNALSWARSGHVCLDDKDLPAGDFELLDPTTGGVVYHQREGGRVAFIAPPVPPCGYLVLEVRPVTRRLRPGPHADWYGAKLTLHSEEYTLQFHERGGMARWHDRSQSAQWCSDEAEFPMGTYLYEMPGDERIQRFARQVHTNCVAHTAGHFNRHDYEAMADFGPVGGGRATITPQITPLYARVTVEAACPVRKVAHRRSGDVQRYRTTFTHYRGRRGLCVNVQLVGKRATYGAEAGYAFFPFSGDEPFVLVDRIAHQLNPAEDLAKGVNGAHLAAGRGVRIEMSHSGMNFYPLDTPLISFGRPGAYLYDERGKHKTGVLYANLFNNCWGTNFAQWQSGDFSYDFVLQPTGNDDWDGGLAKGGAEVYRPLLARVVRGRPAAPSRSLLSVTPETVQLVTLKPADFVKSGTVIRLWNADVEKVRARVRLPVMRRKDGLYRCDLLERPTKRRIKVSAEGEAALTLGPNEIVTLLLQHQR